MPTASAGEEAVEPLRKAVLLHHVVGDMSSPNLQTQIREISAQLRDHGYTVRREALRRGHGFRVRSGECRLYKDKVILIDSTLTPQEQLALLKGSLPPKTATQAEVA